MEMSHWENGIIQEQYGGTVGLCWIDNYSTIHIKTKTKLRGFLVRERTIPTERPPPVGEVSANFCGSYTYI